MICDMYVRRKPPPRRKGSDGWFCGLRKTARGFSGLRSAWPIKRRRLVSRVVVAGAIRMYERTG